MPLQLIRDDITKVRADAIVNATNEYLIPGGIGVDAAIHAAAGPSLALELSQIGYCPTGSVVVTESHGISQCRYIFHAATPVFTDGKHSERTLLENCYISALEAAEEYSLESIAFPLLSSGANGYPRPEAYAIATSIIREYFISHESDLMVYLVLYGRESLSISKRAGDNTIEKIDDGYISMKRLTLIDARRYHRRALMCEYTEGLISAKESSPYDEPEKEELPDEDSGLKETAPDYESATCFGSMPHEFYAAPKFSREDNGENASASCASCAPSQMPKAAAKKQGSLSLHIKRKEKQESLPEETCIAEPEQAKDYHAQDLSFGQMCDWWMKRKGMTIGEFYSKANLSRATYSKIKKNPGAIPKLSSALACVIALKLNREQADDLLQRAGLALTVHNPVMKVVLTYIERGTYDIDIINAELYDKELSLIGTIQA